jgi:hypothetical protein
MPVIILNTDVTVKNEIGVFILPVMSLFLLYYFFQKSPRIVFDEEYITVRYLFKTNIRSWSSVREIFLSKKESYLLQYLEATTITFDDSDKLYMAGYV